MRFSEWKEFKLGDIALFKNGKGIADNLRCDDGLYSIYGSNGVIGKTNEKLIDTPIVIIGRVGAYCGSVQFSTSPCWVTDNAVLGSGTQKLDTKYLYYFLNSFPLRNLASGSAQPLINQKILNNINLSIPPLEEQKAIADILSSLDEKIELNNQMNETLEEMAQALFKRWFVDFEFPNEDGQPYKSSDGEMVESELGMIPNGWTHVRLKDLCEVITKGTTPTTLKKQFVSKGINFIKAESITSTHYYDKSKFNYIDDETHALLKRSVLHEGDILLSIAGTIGKLALVTNDILPANTNQAISIIRVNRSKISLLYIYCYFLCNQHLNYVHSRTVQAVQANLSLGVIGDMSIILPSKDVLSIFNKKISPIFKMIEYNNKQNNCLIGIRDTLLPKLMSGEIRVSDFFITKIDVW